jgi:hypothetical protein
LPFISVRGQRKSSGQGRFKATSEVFTYHFRVTGFAPSSGAPWSSASLIPEPTANDDRGFRLAQQAGRFDCRPVRRIVGLDRVPSRSFTKVSSAHTV